MSCVGRSSGGSVVVWGVSFLCVIWMKEINGRDNLEMDVSSSAACNPHTPEGNFGFAFNDSNFSDRVLCIEILGSPSSGNPSPAAPDGGCSTVADWARLRKRPRDDFPKKDTRSLSFSPPPSPLPSPLLFLFCYPPCVRVNEHTRGSHRFEARDFTFFFP